MKRLSAGSTVDRPPTPRCWRCVLALAVAGWSRLNMPVKTATRFLFLFVLISSSCRTGGQFADDVARIASREASSVDDVTRSIDDAVRQTGQSRDDLAQQWRQSVDQPIVPAIQSSIQSEDVALDIARAALCAAAEEVVETGVIPSAESVGQATFESLLEQGVPRFRAQALAEDVQSIFLQLEAGEAGSAVFEVQLLLLKHRYC